MRSSLDLRRLVHVMPGSRLGRIIGVLRGIALASLFGGIAFLLHFNLSAGGSVELLLVVLVSLRYGVVEATAVSLTAVVCLNYLFTPPIFQFTVADPQNWISLATFEVTALLVSRQSSKVRLHASQAELQRTRAEKLYELSRAILLLGMTDRQNPVREQLSALIREMLQVREVDLWLLPEWVLEGHAAPPAARPLSAAEGSAWDTYQTRSDKDDPVLCLSCRVLRLGATPIGAITLRDWEIDPLLADAVASMASIALERARAVQKENRAEAARNTEQLRTAVLDGLAHGFKTPLTAIQAASSGLLAIGRLTPTQAELVGIIDQQSSMLNHLSTRLLQTAALEAKEVRLQRSAASIPQILQDLVEEQEEGIQSRVIISAPAEVGPVQVDRQLVELALLQLIDNAAKYSAVGENIEVTVHQSSSETTVVVANRGSPVRPWERERIFDRFYRGTDAAHGPAGTGLGLSIVKKTAEAHGGRAWVECENGATRFFFTMQHHGGSEE